MKFAGKVIAITGASSGIGAATSKLFSREGASVVMVGRNKDKLAAVETQCKSVGNAPLVLRADVSNEDDARRIINETIDKYGKLDVLVNNAGIARTASFLSKTLMASYDEIMNINLRALFHLSSLAAPHLIKSKGNIVNISSIAGTKILPGTLAYCVSKAGVLHFTRGVALELAKHGVRVNSVSPGPVDTDIFENAGAKISWEDQKNYTALKRYSEPEEVAELIAYLASDAARGITGADFLIDNGTKLR